MARRRDIPWELWLGCLAAAVLAHGVLVVPSTRALARSLNGFEPKPVEDQVLALDLLEPEVEPEEFVEVDAANEQRPVDSKRVAERDSDVERETKAPTGTGAPAVAGTQPGEPNEASPDSAEPATEGDDSLVEAPDGSQPGPHSATDVAKTWGKLGGSPGALHDSFGTPGRPDRLPEVEQDSQSVLDSKQHLYASFFSRMRGRILEHWNAQKAIDRYDPQAKQLGGVPRTTVVKIRLDQTGAIDSLVFDQESSVDYLDEEAIRALKAAGPFPNPPAGLFDSNGLFEITVAFTVEPDGSARVFRSTR